MSDFNWVGAGYRYTLQTADGYFAIVERLGADARALIVRGQDRPMVLDTWIITASPPWEVVVKGKKAYLQDLIMADRKKQSVTP